MKCEICHKATAEAAIVRGEGEKAEELYVCKSCAREERVKRQKRSQRTRKIMGSGMSMSVTEIGGEGENGEPPQFIGEIINAFENMVSNMEKAAKEVQSPEGAEKKAEEEKASAKKKVFDLSKIEIDTTFKIGNRLHLEGLQMMGDIDGVKRAVDALRMELVGVDFDGIHNAGHVYELHYEGTEELARRIAEGIVREERNARIRLFEELPRVLGDSICRALAILKNCRLLSTGELFDLLSPLRIAAKEDMLDGISGEEIEELIASIDIGSGEDSLEQDERDRVDSERADEINKRFEDVVLNERAGGKFL